MRFLVLCSALLVSHLVSAQICPKFQSIIPLKTSATSSNFSYAVISEGKYHLIGDKERPVQPSGQMPVGFEDSRLNTVIDGSECAQPHYRLVSIKAFDGADGNAYINMTTLDLTNWNQSSQWSSPQSIRNEPILSQDPRLQQFRNIRGVENWMSHLVYWHNSKKLFFIFETDRVDKYFWTDAHQICDQTFSFGPVSGNYPLLRSDLKSLVQPIDFCFIRDMRNNKSMIVCQANTTLHVYKTTPSFNGSLVAELVNTSNADPKYSISKFRDIKKMCFEMADHTSTPLTTIPTWTLEPQEQEDYFDDPQAGMNARRPDHRQNADDSNNIIELTTPGIGTVEESTGLSSTIIIIIVCLILMVLLIVAIGVTATRKTNQMARM